MSALSRMTARVDAWLTRPETNAAGRAGLFRILYALFYLWHLAEHEVASLIGLRAAHRYFILIIKPFPVELPTWFYLGMESALVFVLVLLLMGVEVRWATAAVLLIGTVYEGFFTATDIEHETIFVAVWIPLFMLIADRWGDTYSLDAMRRRRRDGTSVPPKCDAWQYHLPARANLVVLSVLFFNAAYFKIRGTWLDQPEFFANLVLEKNVDAAVLGLHLNPLAPTIAGSWLLYSAMLYGTIAYEALFILALLGPRLRNLMISFTLIFHSVCAIWLSVTFTPILVLYAMYVDLEAWFRRIAFRLPSRLTSLSPVMLSWVTVTVGLVCAVLWNTPYSVRHMITFHGHLNWMTMFYPVLPVSLAWFAVSVVRLVMPGRARSAREL